MLLTMQLTCLRLWLSNPSKDLRLILLNMRANFHLMNGWKSNTCILKFKMGKMFKSSKALYLIESFPTWSYAMQMILKKCLKIGIQQQLKTAYLESACLETHKRTNSCEESVKPQLKRGNSYLKATHLTIGTIRFQKLLNNQVGRSSCNGTKIHFSHSLI